MPNIKNYFTKYDYKLAIYLQNPIETLILCNLINKLDHFSDKELKEIDGKKYHFFYSKEEIYTKELGMSKKVYNNAIKLLQEKQLIETFAGKNPTDLMKNITYFKLNISLINSIIGNKEEDANKTKEASNKSLKQRKNVVKQDEQSAEMKKLELDYKKGIISEKNYLIKKKTITEKNRIL